MVRPTLIPESVNVDQLYLFLISAPAGLTDMSRAHGPSGSSATALVTVETTYSNHLVSLKVCDPKITVLSLRPQPPHRTVA